MFRVLKDSSEATNEFITGLLIGCEVMLVLLVIILALAWDRKRKFYAGPLAMLVFTGIVLLVWNTYRETYACFNAIDVSGTGLRLRFDGPFAREVVVSPGAIDSVLFGLPGKSNRQCFIRVVLRNGDNYRSTTFDQPAAQCKELRQGIVQALKR